jgi:hypothetical protein
MNKTETTGRDLAKLGKPPSQGKVSLVEKI